MKNQRIKSTCVSQTIEGNDYDFDYYEQAMSNEHTRKKTTVVKVEQEDLA